MIFIVLGLILDIFGVILLFRFGILPNNIFDHLLWDSGMEDSDLKKHRLYSKVGLISLTVGFMFQLLGTILLNK